MKIDQELLNKHRGTLDIWSIEMVEGLMWRTSQHPTKEEAEKVGACTMTEYCQSYDSAYDMLLAMCRLANLMDHGSASSDIKIELTINGEDQEPCYLYDATDVLDMFLIKKGYFRPHKGYSKP